jgi:hypothetical protein
MDQLMKTLKRSKIQEFLDKLGGRVFTVEFFKKDGTLRMMNCRKGVTRHLSGDGPSTTAHIEKYVTVFDMQLKQYRNINKETMVAIRANGVERIIVEN